MKPPRPSKKNLAIALGILVGLVLGAMTGTVFWVLLVSSAWMACRWYYTRRMKTELCALEDRYGPIVELSKQLFYDYDVTSGSITWSGAILSVTGYRPEEFQSVDISRWADMIHPDDLRDALNPLEQARFEVSHYRVEYRFRKKNSGYTHVEDEGRFFPDEGGRAVRMLGTMKDITIRKKAERQLQQAHAALRQLNNELEARVHQRTSELTLANQKLLKSEEQFRTIFEYVTIGMCLTSIRGRYRMVNRSLCAMLGYGEQELLSKSIEDVTHPEDVLISRERMDRLLHGEKSTEIYEKRYRHRSGRTVWALVGIYLLNDGEGKPSHFIAHIQDITRRKQDHAQVQRLHAAIEQAVEGVVITSPEGMVEYVNPAFGHVTGYSPAEAMGRDPLFFSSSLRNTHFYSEIRDALSAGRLWAGRVTADKKNGATMLLEASVSPICGNAGQNFGYVAVIRDVTEKQRLENRLKQAQKMEAIGTLAGGIAHDFNNILGGIIGCSEMALLEVPAESVAHSDLEKILEAGMRAKSLIKQILTFSRQGECEMVPVDLPVMVKEAVKLLRVSFPPDIDIRIHAPRETGAVMADPIQMHQVLMNLCTNALHAMQDKGGVLDIDLAETNIGAAESRTQSDLKPGAYLQLTVRDSGCGIPAEIVERIFDPFFTTKKVGEGTGLGLSAVHGIIRKHGGAITVSSRPGMGTTFCVLIPLLRTAVVKAAHRGSDPPSQRQRTHFAGGRRKVADRRPAPHAGRTRLPDRCRVQRFGGRRSLPAATGGLRPGAHRSGHAGHDGPRTGPPHHPDQARRARSSSAPVSANHCRPLKRNPSAYRPFCTNRWSGPKWPEPCAGSFPGSAAPRARPERKNRHPWLTS